MSETDYMITASTICLVCIFAPKLVALCFIAIAMAAAYWTYRQNTKRKP